jgi:hypothetical protein
MGKEGKKVREGGEFSREQARRSGERDKST